LKVTPTRPLLAPNNVTMLMLETSHEV
jgi:hypothetical protein